MSAQITEKPYEIARGKTRITLPSGVSVAHPFYGPANAKSLRDTIRADGLMEPNGIVFTEFLTTAYNHKEPEFTEARDITRRGYFRVFEGYNYDGDSERLFVVSPDFVEFGKLARLVIPGARELENMLKDGDTRVRALPFEELHQGVFKVSRPEDVAKVRPYLETVYGEEGAEDLISHVASKTRKGVIHTWFPTMPSSGEQKLRIAALDVDLAGSRLYVYGRDGLGEGGYAFGMFPSREAAR